MAGLWETPEVQVILRTADQSARGRLDKNQGSDEHHHEPYRFHLTSSAGESIGETWLSRSRQTLNSPAGLSRTLVKKHTP